MENEKTGINKYPLIRDQYERIQIIPSEPDGSLGQTSEENHPATVLATDALQFYAGKLCPRSTVKFKVGKFHLTGRSEKFFGTLDEEYYALMKNDKQLYTLIGTYIKTASA